MLEPPLHATRARLGYRTFLGGIACLWAAYTALVAWPVFKAAQSACFRYYDLGIYAQGIARLQLWDTNPWLSGRQLRLFFDHVDPVVWTAVLLRWPLGPMGAALVTESLWIMLSVWPLLAYVRAAKLTPSSALVCACVLLFNPATLAAAQFPAHPTTWAMAPMFACVLALSLGEYKKASWPLALLMACKEEFAWCALVWGIRLGWRHGPRDDAPDASVKRRVGRMWILASCTWLVGVYVLRPLGGHTAAYPTQLWSGVWSQGLDYWTVRALDPMLWQRLTTVAIGIGPFAWVLWCGAEGALQSSMGGVLWGLAPCIAIRFLGLAWGYQYDACLGAGLIAWLVTRWGARYRPTLLGVGVTVSGLGAAWLYNGTCADAGTMGVTLGHYGHARTQCTMVPERAQSLASGSRMMLADPTQNILVGQNLAPLVAHHPLLYVLGGPQPRAAMRYHQVWVEVPPMGDAWPLSAQVIRAAIQVWRTTPGVEILVDDGAMFIARGALPYPANATFQ